MAAQHEQSHEHTLHPALPQELSDCAIFRIVLLFGEQKSDCEAIFMFDRIQRFSHLELRFLHCSPFLLWLVILHD